MFTYCNNNPVYRYDPSGLAFRVCVSHFDDEGGGYPIWTYHANTPEEQTSGMINGQGRLPYSNNRIGLGTYGSSGCAYIAVYNAMQLIGKGKSLHSITQDFLYKYGVVFFGAGGVAPMQIEAYIQSQGIAYTSSSSMSDLTDNISEGSVIIFTVWNDKSDIFSGWHAMTALYTEGSYLVFNQYNDSKTFSEFSSLDEAFPKGVWLHGIRID